ncbi:MAG: hypothetical protein ACYDAS_01600 [Patescibacteria group bacterium]
MAKLDVDIKSYIAENIDKNVFSHVYMHLPQDESLIETRGKLFSAIDIKGPEGFDGQAFIDPFLDDLEDEYFTDTVSSILNILDKSINTAYTNMSKKIIDENIESNVDFNIICLVIWGDIVYMARIGTSLIYLLRENKILNLSNHLLSVSQNVVSTASGYAKDGDIFVLATSGSNLYLTEDKINQIVTLEDSDLSELNIGVNNGDISFFVIDINDTGDEINDKILEESYTPDMNENEVRNDQNIENESLQTSNNSDANLDLGRFSSDKIKNTINGFDLRRKSSNVSSFLKSNSVKTSSKVGTRVKEEFKKIEWKKIAKSIITVIITFSQLLIDSALYLKDRTKRQYKVRIARDIDILKNEKWTVICIIVVIIFAFFFLR